MCQSRGGARRTAAQAFTLENDGTGPGQQAGGNAVNSSFTRLKYMGTWPVVAETRSYVLLLLAR